MMMNNNTFLDHAGRVSLGLTVAFLGVMAGFFWTYTFNINLAMQQVDGQTYATMQSLFNQNVRHPMFFMFFFGSGAIAILAVLLNFRHRQSLFFWLIVLAAIVYIAGIIIFTKQVNLPLNAYTESWDPLNLPMDWQATRDSWNQANAFRTMTSFVSLLLSTSALMLRSSTNRP